MGTPGVLRVMITGACHFHSNNLSSNRGSKLEAPMGRKSTMVRTTKAPQIRTLQIVWGNMNHCMGVSESLTS